MVVTGGREADGWTMAAVRDLSVPRTCLSQESSISKPALASSYQGRQGSGLFQSRAAAGGCVSWGGALGTLQPWFVC
ncbi:hypothetical protein B0T18DRAFT_406208 [Schizothecium vesticola]|uniref:Uncharacterized protein n=1 Tax=Schizothecium vesticola TaxID=314040 RepID=A0AA40K8H1_9PEZI|nr:hypothetical protein B0T18DRAFT_406208 [Schizothecium vesticola]